MARGRAKGNVRVVGIGESVVPAGGTANVAVMGVTTVVPAPPDGMAAGAVATGGASAGYSALADLSRSRLKWFGPAFGTKFLHFCSPAGRPPALILDRLVADWLRDHADVSLNPVPWHTGTYRRYLDLMAEWSDDLRIDADQLEACIFTDQASRTGSQWG